MSPGSTAAASRSITSAGVLPARAARHRVGRSRLRPSRSPEPGDRARHPATAWRGRGRDRGALLCSGTGPVTWLHVCRLLPMTSRNGAGTMGHMDTSEPRRSSTAAVADASLARTSGACRPGIRFGRCFPAGPSPGRRGRSPISASVDVFLEVIDDAPPGERPRRRQRRPNRRGVRGRPHHSRGALGRFRRHRHLGLHRDTAQLRQIALPVVSLGATSFGRVACRRPAGRCAAPSSTGSRSPRTTS